MPVDRPQLDVASRAELRRWLDENHESSSGVWFVRWKKGRPRHVPYGDIAEEALCFGWIDSQARPLDDDRSLILLTPRRPTSMWSKVNKERIERLEASGQMRPAGRAAVDGAKVSGTWSALDDIDALVEPPDLTEALDGNAAAREAWDGFPPSAKRAILAWILSAKRPETRAKRIAVTADEAAVGRRANEWRPPKT
jgi:uncharacterized protein YdeI (YjbR/CyaY-like superfamily)